MFGVLLILAGIALGLYVGGYLLFIGGIIDFVDGIDAEPTDSELIAWGVAKVVFAGLVGWGIFIACSSVGLFMFSTDKTPKRSRPGGSMTSRQVEREWERRTRQHTDDDSFF